MSFIVEQKINGRIYLYRVTTYWDKDKQQPRQKREYIGPKHKRLNKPSIKKEVYRNIITVNYGNILLLDSIVAETGLASILEQTFTENWREILGLCYYDIMEGEAMYKFSYWQQEQYLADIRNMYSSDISDLFDTIGGMQKERMEFMIRWADHLKPIEGIYYDITSISSYSGNIDFVEWGYNRDDENLPQINMGMVCCQEKALPFFYSILPGSIVDVATLKNQVKYLDVLELKDLLLIMDRGFCSTTNIRQMDQAGLHFLQPLTFTLKSAKEIINENKEALHKSNYAFKYNEEILHYRKSKITIGNKDYDAHIYLNEKAELGQKHLLLSKLIQTEELFKDKVFATKQQYEDYISEHIADKLKPYYLWNKKSKRIIRNQKTFEDYLAYIGYIIFASNKKGLDKSKVLECYRHKDNIEKMFDVFKNQINGDRLRVHDNWNMHGKVFLKFITLIIYMRISQIMKENNLFKKYSLKEMLLMLSKIKLTTIPGHEPIISELSKKQKEVIKIFNLNIET